MVISVTGADVASMPLMPETETETDDTALKTPINAVDGHGPNHMGMGPTTN